MRFPVGHLIACSDFLKDRHPYRDPPFRKDIDPSEVAVAYGRRSSEKLLENLANFELLPAQHEQVCFDSNSVAFFLDK